MGIAIVSTYPPNKCGVGEFAFNLREGLIASGQTRVPVIAVADEYITGYGPEVIQQIKAAKLEDYDAAAEFLNSDAIDVIIIQHEFGIFGGIGGIYIFQLLKKLKKPVIVTFHTIPETSFYGGIFSGILKSIDRFSQKTIALSQYGSHLLHSDYYIDANKISVIPNGVPDIPTRTREDLIKEFNFTNRTVAMTFGLLAPYKGLELVLNAIPDVIETNPEFLYLIIGETHPKELMLNGERYRNGLSDLIDQLEIKNHVRFIPRYLSVQEIMDYLIASDIFITPYPHVSQNSSATLTYAAYHGKACLSTPYNYAEELLADGCGLLCPYNEETNFQKNLKYLVANPNIRISMGNKLKEKVKNWTWPEIANKYLELINSL